MPKDGYTSITVPDVLKEYLEKQKNREANKLGFEISIADYLLRKKKDGAI